MSDRLSVLPQYLMPKRAMTVFAGHCAGSQTAWWTRNVIPWFIRRYGVDMDEAADSNPANYLTFNAFFTRALKDGVRPLADAALVCPVDGAISQLGPIKQDRIIQAKGHDYSVRTLLGGTEDELARQLEGGQFATIYLSPRDYHRIHMPCAGRLRQMIYVPGAFFSVNPTTARGVPGLFARNERVVCVFDSAFGPFVLALVGATIVGSMATVWHGVVNPRGTAAGTVRQWRYDDQPVELAKGEEMGRFLLGSTIVLLLPPGDLRFNPDWAPERGVRLGESMARVG
ncbi:MAG: archaetidylserine decarboxylase [Burkholderiaceae bacterium]